MRTTQTRVVLFFMVSRTRALYEKERPSGLRHGTSGAGRETAQSTYAKSAIGTPRTQTVQMRLRSEP